ncbi:nitroreductase family protein [Companilactobacillus halodurans]|uniref:Nitroreductase n=1 Tax=Companilactobacillus halodurans TaxID=2584183 RepID=A0A5P0ZQ23_9LACO|nr:nitroreductase family protein [Companilactobacillus halodurans]MQS76219.1 nitroreductase [Companilactobacillus halodurans]MQS97359.1 nitroreductase [Companilactobacillus halodurans]
MEAYDLIKSRKAIRQYSGQITDEQLNEILTAANAGPVGMGEYKNYRLTVIQKADVLNKMSGIYDAPTVIVVSAKNPEAMEDVSAGAIVHNMELAAENLGLGANYNMSSLGSIPSGVLPSGFKAVFALTLGQTNEKLVTRSIPLDRIETNIVK